MEPRAAVSDRAQTPPTRDLLVEWLDARLAPADRAWCAAARAEIAAGAPAERFAALLSLASRHAPRGPLAPSADERAAAARALGGFEPERWSQRDALRVALVLARSDLSAPSGAAAIEEAFRYADEGELVALYRALAHLPDAGRFGWRAGEGCRSNMRTVFEAAACDTPYPARWFDEVAWRQCLIKALFVGAPLWRVHGLDTRLDAELARIALDLADERRAAARPVPPELWLCLGPHGGARGLASLERELASAGPRARAGAGLGLARAGATEALRAARTRERDPAVAAALDAALAGTIESPSLRAHEGLPER